jgi:hypothetical protein
MAQVPLLITPLLFSPVGSLLKVKEEADISLGGLPHWQTSSPLMGETNLLIGFIILVDLLELAGPS